MDLETAVKVSLDSTIRKCHHPHCAMQHHINGSVGCLVMNARIAQLLQYQTAELRCAAGMNKHMAMANKGAYSFVQACYGAHQVEHMPQDLVQVSLQAILGSRARPVHHTVIQQSLLEQGVQVLRVCCNDRIQVCCSLHQRKTIFMSRLSVCNVPVEKLCMIPWDGVAALMVRSRSIQ